jgi:AraC-like DNA-binding protein
MNIFTYSSEDYKTVLQKFALYFNNPVINNRVEYPAFIGKGYFELISMPLGINLLLSDFTLYEDVLLIRKKAYNQFLNMRLEIIQSELPVGFSVNDEQRSVLYNQGMLFLTSSDFSIWYKVPAKTVSRSINIQFTKDTLHQLLPKEDVSALLEKLLHRGSEGIQIISADSSLRDIVFELLEMGSHRHKELICFNRCLQVLESFISTLTSEPASKTAVSKAMNKADIEAIRKIEQEITEDLSVVPPSQEELAEKVFMSASKLKYTFKAIYGTSIYNYYQKARMQRALEMLQLGKSVSDTAYSLGFGGTDNFSKSFKKEFNVPPSKVAMQTA